MLRRLYDWTLRLADNPKALWALALISLIESSVFPIPPDVLMIPMILAAPHRAWRIAAVATLASVAGALLGYGIGWGFYDSIGRPVLEFYGKTQSFEEFKETYNAYGTLAVLFAGVTPLPFKVVTLASGVTGLPLPGFIGAALVARALRFFIVAALLYRFGAPIKEFIERRLGLVFTVFCVLLIAGFAALRLL